MEIGIFNETNEKLDKDIDKLHHLLEDFCKREKLNNVEFNIIIINEDKIHEINKKYRGIDRPTDVISFALEDDKTVMSPSDVRILGDIYICIEKVYSQAKEYNHSFEREFSFLAIHGLLHLLGYDHMNEKDEKIMFSKQEEVLSYYGIER